MNRSNSFVSSLKWWPLQGHNNHNNQPAAPPAGGGNLLTVGAQLAHLQLAAAAAATAAPSPAPPGTAHAKARRGGRHLRQQRRRSETARIQVV